MGLGISNEVRDVGVDVFNLQQISVILYPNYRYSIA